MKTVRPGKIPPATTRPPPARPIPRLAGANLLQRKCACGGTPGPGGECTECRKKREAALQRRARGPASDVAPPIVHEVLRSGGQSMDPVVRARMEPRFGYDFSHVRVHTDGKAADSARAVNALAYTVGRDVVFASGQYQPTSSHGQKLMAHELTHVVQQGGSPSSSRPASLALAATGDAAENEAHAAAAAVTRGEFQSPKAFGGVALARQRAPAATPPGPIPPAFASEVPGAPGAPQTVRPCPVADTIVHVDNESGELIPALAAARDDFRNRVMAEPGNPTFAVSSEYRSGAYQAHFYSLRTTFVALNRLEQIDSSVEAGRPQLRVAPNSPFVNCRPLVDKLNGEIRLHSLVPGVPDNAPSVSNPDNPNTAAHTQGRAFDASIGGLTPERITELAALAGLYRPYLATDRVHFELSNTTATGPRRR